MPKDQPAFSSMVVSQPTRATGFLASAATLNVGPGVRAKPLVQQEWQKEAWHWFDEIAEYRYACEWVGNLLSRAKLSAYENGEPTKNQLALDAMASFAGGPDGQAEIQRLLGIHFTAVGEAYLFADAGAADDGTDQWFVAAATEVTRSGSAESGWKYRYDSETYDNAWVQRLWRPHPRLRSESDSASRPLLRKLAQIDRLDRHIDAQADSRLIGNGLLLIPSEISFASAGEDGGAINNASAEQFLQRFFDVASEAIADPGSAKAKIPMVLQGAGEHLDKVKLLKFWSELDEKAVELQKEAIRRFALGMDMPPEIIEGTADMNHWGSWQVEEASIKAHTEPLLGVITRSLASAYLYPILRAAGIDPSTFSIHADTTEMRLRPNRSKEAVELYDRGELKGETLRRENGFSEADKMDDAEFRTWQLKKIAGGSSTPEMVDAANRALNVDLPLAPLDGGVVQVQEKKPTEARPRPSLKEHPVREIPDIDPAVVAAAEVHIARALERAGNKMRTRYGVKSPAAISAYQVAELDAAGIDDVLDDAWSTVGFGQSAPLDERALRAMDAYTRSLIASGSDHNVTLLRRYLLETK